MTTLLIAVILAGLFTLLLRRRRRARAKEQQQKNQIYMQSFAAAPVAWVKIQFTGCGSCSNCLPHSKFVFHFPRMEDNINYVDKYVEVNKVCFSHNNIFHLIWTKMKGLTQFPIISLLTEILMGIKWKMGKFKQGQVASRPVYSIKTIANIYISILIKLISQIN